MKIKTPLIRTFQSYPQIIQKMWKKEKKTEKAKRENGYICSYLLKLSCENRIEKDQMAKSRSR